MLALARTALSPGCANLERIRRSRPFHCWPAAKNSCFCNLPRPDLVAPANRRLVGDDARQKFAQQWATLQIRRRQLAKRRQIFLIIRPVLRRAESHGNFYHFLHFSRSLPPFTFRVDGTAAAGFIPRLYTFKTSDVTFGRLRSIHYRISSLYDHLSRLPILVIWRICKQIR